MIKEAKKLTEIEKERLKKFRKRFKGAKAYYSTDDILSSEYEIIASVLNLTVERNKYLMNDDNSKIITDKSH